MQIAMRGHDRSDSALVGRPDLWRDAQGRVSAPVTERDLRLSASFWWLNTRIRPRAGHDAALGAGLCNSLGQQDGRRMGNVAGLLSVSFRPLTDLEGRAHVELPVHALLPGPEVAGRLGHGDDLGPVDLVGVPTGHDGGGALAEDVLQPVSARAVREGDQEAVIMLDRDDWCLVRPARSPPDMADNRCAGSFPAGRP